MFPDSRNHPVGWVAALGLTVVTFVSLAVLESIGQHALYCAGLFALLSVISQSIRAPTMVILLSLPFVVPVLLIHGILNPQFEPTAILLFGIPLRASGFAFAILISFRVVAIFLIAGFWWGVDRDIFLGDLIALKVPVPVIMAAAQAISVSSLIRRRAHKILEALTARGVRVGPGLLTRILTLPKMVIPLFVSVITDSDYRATILATRGFGSGSPAPERPFKLRIQDMLAVVFSLSLTLAVWLVP